MHTRQDNGATLAAPADGPAELTPQEWEDYCAKIRARMTPRGWKEVRA